ncbi:hypothetical protein [Plantactinospora sp. B5E13]|uniref:hypothetical protein n=1 Tax=unclassified Plantactinospora TaxID=2631981 RepID=UPI00325C94F4
MRGWSVRNRQPRPISRSTDFSRRVDGYPKVFSGLSRPLPRHKEDLFEVAEHRHHRRGVAALENPGHKPGHVVGAAERFGDPDLYGVDPVQRGGQDGNHRLR